MKKLFSTYLEAWNYARAHKITKPIKRINWYNWGF